MFMMVSEQT